jgi:hypothetical protein
MPTIHIPKKKHWDKVGRALVASGPVARVSQEPSYRVSEEQSRRLQRAALPFRLVWEANDRAADRDRGGPLK